MREHLHKADIEVLVIHVKAGKSDKEIGLTLNISPETAAHYRSSFCCDDKPKKKRKKKPNKDD